MVDEAAYVKSDLFKKTIAPLLQEKECAMIAMSSPSDTSSFVYKLSKKLGRDGLPIINYVVIGTQCDDCANPPKDPANPSKKLKKSFGVACKHVPWKLP